MQKRRKLTIRDICMIAVLIALVVVGTFIKIDMGNSAMAHLGSSMIFTAGLVFGGVYGGLAGAMGSAVFDLIGGLGAFTLWSLVIKGLGGLIVGLVAKRGGNRYVKNTWAIDILAVVLGSLAIMGGYMVAWRMVLGSWAIAIGNLPSTIITSSIGIVVSLLVSRPLRRALEKSKLF